MNFYEHDFYIRAAHHFFRGGVLHFSAAVVGLHKPTVDIYVLSDDALLEEILYQSAFAPADNVYLIVREKDADVVQKIKRYYKVRNVKEHKVET